MAGPEIRAASIATALADFPLRDAPAWAVVGGDRRARAHPAAVRSALGAVRRRSSPDSSRRRLYLVFAQLAFNNGRIVVVVPPLAAVITSMVATASLVARGPPGLAGPLPGLSSALRAAATPRTRRLRALLLLIAAFGAVAIPLFLEVTGALKRVDLSTIDARYSVRGDQEPPPDVVLVAFDDVTFDAAQCAVALPAALSRQGHRRS